MERFKRANVIIPAITPTSFSIRLREDNERLIRHLERLERGTFGIKKLFKQK